MTTTRESILSSNDIQIEPVPTPEWGTDALHVKTLDGVARDVQDKLLTGGDKDEGYHTRVARFIAACACDAEGALLFAETDIEALSKKASHVLKRVFTAALAVNGIGKAALEKTTKN